MKRVIGTIAACLFVTSIASADTLPVKPISPVPHPVPTVNLPPLVLQCPDPAATSIDFAITARTTRWAGRVRVTGTVKNVGGVPYVSGANQQLALLYETVPGGRPRLVAQRAFQNLAPNEAVTVSFDRDWNSASPAEGEFPPTYRLIVSYDPDIRLDGNPKNDDCMSGNNSRDRFGGEVNALFH